MKKDLFFAVRVRMKGIYFWIGVALFLLCAAFFLNEYRSFYEGFVVVTNPVLQEDKDLLGKQINFFMDQLITNDGADKIREKLLPSDRELFDSIVAEYFIATRFLLNPSTESMTKERIISLTYTLKYAGEYLKNMSMFAGNLETSIGPLGKYIETAFVSDKIDASPTFVNPPASPASTTTTPTTPSTNTTTTMATGAASNQTPGSTSSSQVSAGTLSATTTNFGYLEARVVALGGKDKVLEKLSRVDKDFFNEVYQDLSGMMVWAADSSKFPFTEAQAIEKAKKALKTGDYISTAGFASINPTTSELKQYVTGTLANTTQPSNNTTPNGTPSQFTMNDIPLSELLANTTADPSLPFATGRSDSQTIDASDLQELITRVAAIVSAMKSINSNEPVILARIQNLEQLNVELREMKDAIIKGEMKPEELPIKVGDARRFLRASIELEKQLPSIISIPEARTASNGGSGAMMGGDNPMGAGDLLNMARFLKWNINVSFDTDLYAREQMAQRVDKIVGLLQSKKIDSSEAKAILQTLSDISGKVGPAHHKKSNVFKSENEEVFETSSRKIQPGYMPDKSQLSQITDGGFDNVRPAIGPNSYLNRGSATYAVYEHKATAGGPNYKDRLTNLCTQITRSGLGTGEELGCMKDITQVGNDYGWKGAYLMVCNRLNDTWGGNYPEMFGCPKQDPSSRFL